MRIPKLLIVYASRYGQTEKIARRIAEVVDAETRVVAVADADGVALEDYEAAIIAGGVYFGRHERKLEEFVQRKIATLSAIQSAFISVSGSQNEKYVHDFARRTGWVPEIYATFRGGEAYTKYGLFLRWLMRAIARSQGRTVDVHRDYEFTDWGAVDRFARDFLGYAAAKRSA